MNAKLTLLATLSAAAALVAALVLMTAVYTVDPAEQVIITQFGQPQGEPIDEAGLHFKVPFIQQVNRIPKLILPWDGQTNEMPTKDKLYIRVDTFGRWRVTDPLEYFRRLRDERSALSRLEDILGSETRNAVAKHDLIEMVRTDRERQPVTDESLEVMAEGVTGRIGVLMPIRKGRSAIEAEIGKEAKAKLAPFGIELLDLRFKRINYNPSVVEKIYERMVSERQQIAAKFRAEGEGEAARILGSKERDLDKIESEAYREVQTIRGEADAKATEIYARAYNQTPEAAALYEFIKSMETNRTVIGQDATLVLTTDSDLFRYLKRADGKRVGAGSSPPAPDAPPADSVSEP